MIARRKFHRLVFGAAGIYNLVWGAYAVYDPQWLFRFSGLPPLNHPQIFACLAMVVGLYGIIYLEVARVPERGWLLAAVGLLGKLLGPRFGLVDLEGNMASVDNCLVRNKRSYLVDSLFDLPA